MSKSLKQRGREYIARKKARKSYPLVEADPESRRHVIIRLDEDLNWHRVTKGAALKLSARIEVLLLEASNAMRRSRVVTGSALPPLPTDQLDRLALFLSNRESVQRRTGFT